MPLGLRVRTRILTLGFKRVDRAVRKQQAINPHRFISIYSTCLLYNIYIYFIWISGNLRYLINTGDGSISSRFPARGNFNTTYLAKQIWSSLNKHSAYIVFPQIEANKQN